MKIKNSKVNRDVLSSFIIKKIENDGNKNLFKYCLGGVIWCKIEG